MYDRPQEHEKGLDLAEKNTDFVKIQELQIYDTLTHTRNDAHCTDSLLDKFSSRKCNFMLFNPRNTYWL